MSYYLEKLKDVCTNVKTEYDEGVLRIDENTQHVSSNTSFIYLKNFHSRSYENVSRFNACIVSTVS